MTFRKFLVFIFSVACNWIIYETIIIWYHMKVHYSLIRIFQFWGKKIIYGIYIYIYRSSTKIVVLEVVTIISYFCIIIVFIKCRHVVSHFSHHTPAIIIIQNMIRLNWIYVIWAVLNQSKVYTILSYTYLKMSANLVKYVIFTGTI